MDNQKILLVNLAKGRIGEDNAVLLGSLIVTKLQLSALSRIDIPEKKEKTSFALLMSFKALFQPLVTVLARYSLKAENTGFV